MNNGVTVVEGNVGLDGKRLAVTRCSLLVLGVRNLCGSDDVDYNDESLMEDACRLR